MLDLLVFDEEKARPYKSSSQKVRIMSEDWFSHFMYCPVCGERKLEKFGFFFLTEDYLEIYNRDNSVMDSIHFRQPIDWEYIKGLGNSQNNIGISDK